MTRYASRKFAVAMAAVTGYLAANVTQRAVVKPSQGDTPNASPSSP